MALLAFGKFVFKGIPSMSAHIPPASTSHPAHITNQSLLQTLLQTYTMAPRLTDSAFWNLISGAILIVVVFTGQYVANHFQFKDIKRVMRSEFKDMRNRFNMEAPKHGCENQRHHRDFSFML